MGVFDQHYRYGGVSLVLSEQFAWSADRWGYGAHNEDSLQEQEDTGRFRNCKLCILFSGSIQDFALTSMGNLGHYTKSRLNDFRKRTPSMSPSFLFQNKSSLYQETQHVSNNKHPTGGVGDC